MNDDKQPVAWKLVPTEPIWEMVIAACPPGETVDHFSIKDALRAALAASPTHTESAAPAFDMLAHLQRQREFSERTFGPGTRTAGVVDHIRKELREIEADPSDLSEWADVVILALDGFWRAGASPQQIIDTIVAKQTKNEGRVWPDWRTMPTDKAIEHDRSHDTPAPSPVSADEHCMCPACRDGVIHASDCAVHNGPALAIGPCDCGTAPAPSPVSGTEMSFEDFRDRCEHYHGFKYDTDESQCTCPGNDHAGSWCDEGDCPFRTSRTDAGTSPVSGADERAAFEAWVRKEFSDGEDDPCKRGQCGYLDSTVDSVWIGWQARAALAPTPTVTVDVEHVPDELVGNPHAGGTTAYLATEHYNEGWNDCRGMMLETLKARAILATAAPETRVEYPLSKGDEAIGTLIAIGRLLEDAGYQPQARVIDAMHDLIRDAKKGRTAAPATADARDVAPPIPWRLIVQAIRAVGEEAARRGEMYPQTSDEQVMDRKATRRVTEQIEWYATHGGAVAERLADWPRIDAAMQRSGQ